MLSLLRLLNAVLLFSLCLAPAQAQSSAKGTVLIKEDFSGGEKRTERKLGHHLVLSKDTPLCNVWLTMINGLGIEAERHCDSTGVVKELMA